MAHKYKLRSAISTDIPIMTEIFAGAFSNDRHTQLKVESGADPIGDMGRQLPLGLNLLSAMSYWRSTRTAFLSVGRAGLDMDMTHWRRKREGHE